MNLSFAKYWPKRMPKHLAEMRTDFIEKIWSSIPEDQLQEFYKSKYKVDFDDREAMEILLKEKADYPINWPYYDQINKRYKKYKAHTFREDKKDRWGKESDIHFYINTRSTKQFLFAPVIPCKAVQKIQIIHSLSNPGVARIKIDGELYYEGHFNRNSWRLKALAFNDGFESQEDLFHWFNQDFSGKIIHWTNLFKY